MQNYNPREQLPKLFPKCLLGHDMYQVFVNLFTDEFTKNIDLIESLSTLINADRCPEEIIGDLGKLFNFKYNPTLDSDLQRECMKLFFKESESSVGREIDLSRMAQYGDNEGYLGGDLFLPGYDKNPNTTSVVMTRDRMFTLSKSSLSGTDVFPNDIYREGVILITVSRLNDVIKEKVESVKPAGTMIVYAIANSDGTLSYITHQKGIYNPDDHPIIVEYDKE